MNPNNAFFAGMAAALICVLLIGVIFLVCWFFFCLTLQRMQAEVRPGNRLIPPGSVWLHLLHIGGIIPFAGPFFNLCAYVWDLVMVLKLAGSLEREFRRRGWREPSGGYGKPAGLIWGGAGLALTLLNVAFLFVSPAMGNQNVVIVLGLVGLAVWLVSLVCWIIYWVQMTGFGRRLREGRRAYRIGSIEEDYDDEFRGPFREPDDDEDDDRQRDRGDEFEDDLDDRQRRRRRDEDDEDDFEDRPRRRGRDDD